MDERATHGTAIVAILETLSAAGEDDIVLISFAGHGTPDGRLAFFDTDSTDLSGTTLSMSLLAEAFKSTKARVVLLILDCCFSGQAPARVLETAALPRSPVPFADISGEGRTLLADARRTKRPGNNPEAATVCSLTP